MIRLRVLYQPQNLDSPSAASKYGFHNLKAAPAVGRKASEVFRPACAASGPPTSAARSIACLIIQGVQKRGRLQKALLAERESMRCCFSSSSPVKNLKNVEKKRL